MILASAFQGSLGQNLNLWFGMYFAWISTILIVNFEFERLGLILSWKLTGYFHGFWHLGMALLFWLVHLAVWFGNLNFLDYLVCFENFGSWLLTFWFSFWTEYLIPIVINWEDYISTSPLSCYLLMRVFLFDLEADFDVLKTWFIFHWFFKWKFHRSIGSFQPLEA